jgi:hypothetical protein
MGMFRRVIQNSTIFCNLTVMYRSFILLFFALCPVMMFSQTPVSDTTGKSLRLQLDELTREVDSLKAIAIAKSKESEALAMELGNVQGQLQSVREATHYEPQLFIDSLLHRIVVIFTGRSDLIGRTMLQFVAVTETMGKAMSVHTPDQKKQIDGLTQQYIATNKQREAALDEFNKLLTMLDERSGALDKLKKSMVTKREK